MMDSIMAALKTSPQQLVKEFTFLSIAHPGGGLIVASHCISNLFNPKRPDRSRLLTAAAGSVLVVQELVEHRARVDGESGIGIGIQKY